MIFEYTLWDSLLDIDKFTPLSETWPQIVARFGTHIETNNKLTAPGFGPYPVQAPPTACTRHKDRTIATPHRCDACVPSISLAVFDADEGTAAQADACDLKLQSDGLARLWYSSHSYSPGREPIPLRLVIPLATPVPAPRWPEYRRQLIKRYAIPASPTKCSGRSHFYFLPSCPPGAERIFEHSPGEFLRPGILCYGTTHVETQPPSELEGDDDFAPEPPPGQALELAPALASLRKRLSQLKRDPQPSAQYKSMLLSRLLNGEPLDQHKHRNDATTLVTGMLAWTCPDLPLSGYKHILRPSLEAMQAAGSKLTWPKVENMLRRALRNYHREQARKDAVDSQFRAGLEKAAAMARRNRITSR